MVFKLRKSKSKDATQETTEQTVKKSSKKKSSRLSILGRRKGSSKSGEKDDTSKPTKSERNAADGKKAKRSRRQKKSEFKTPLGTIEEGNDEIEAQTTGKTAKSEDSNDTNLLHNVAIVNGQDGETELVAGEVTDEIRRRLFDHDIEEEPFDAEYAIRKEDPHILEVMKSESNEEEEREEREESKESRYELDTDDIAADRSRRATFDQTYNQKEITERGGNVGILAKNLLNALNCNDATTLMDTMCAQPEVRKTKRIYYNDVFAFRFIQEAIHEGIPMLYHHPPKNPIDNDWTGQSMTMRIRPGDYRGHEVSQPKLEWSTVDGGWSRLTGTSAKVISVSLMDIHSIMDQVEEGEENNENFCFFSITTMGGYVHLLECSDENERDRVVTGIRNILCQLSKGIVAGDDTVTKDLYTNMEEAGELPLRTHEQIFKVTSHDFLDSLGNSI